MTESENTPPTADDLMSFVAVYMVSCLEAGEAGIEIKQLAEAYAILDAVAAAQAAR